jgi:hypothetical protein
MRSAARTEAVIANGLREPAGILARSRQSLARREDDMQSGNPGRLALLLLIYAVPVTSAVPLGDAGDFFDHGWQASGGATFHFSPDVPVGMRLDLGYSRLPAIEQAVGTGTFPAQVQVDDGRLAVTHLMLDALWEFGGGRVGGWLGAGVGVLHRRIEVTYTVPEVVLFPLALGLPIDVSGGGGQAESHDQLTQIGFDLNAAIRFPLRSGSEIYLEARYQRMESEPATEFIPLVLGFRW